YDLKPDLSIFKSLTAVLIITFVSQKVFRKSKIAKTSLLINLLFFSLFDKYFDFVRRFNINDIY
ncbi:MAG TPA: hypothetical protein PLW30_08305, partial [Candidatus Saccharicenans sp.]|nr:hypothetical protein [Candidatus Saccharicenans sp.]HQE65128.1 hypothetical protein [Candidatus Saccharicenans sp.]